MTESEEDAARVASALRGDPGAHRALSRLACRRAGGELAEEPETVHVFYVEGTLSAGEIAGRLGVGKSAITMRQERFRARVKGRALAGMARLRGQGS